MTPSPIKNLFLITGTTRGLGKALLAAARALPDSFVVGFSRAAAVLRDNHQNIPIDLNDTTAIGPALAQIHIDRRWTAGLMRSVLINNAGVLDPIAPIGECDDLALAQNIRVNLLAPLVLSRHFFNFGRSLPGRKWIVNITSGAARTPYSGWSAYGAAKAGLEMATAAMALDFSHTDPAFAVCAVAPGTVDTAMQATLRDCPPTRFPQVGKFLALKDSGGLADPEHVARRLIRIVTGDRLKNGGRYDLRELDD